MVTVIRSDLEFILAQIKISELHSGLYGTPSQSLTSILPNTELPWGLRTVDGRDNNLLPGQSHFGAADTLFPRGTHPFYLNEQDGESFDADGPGPAPAITNTNYGAFGASVVDSNPRVISNLIVDQSPGNPSAVLAALKFAGSEDPEGDLATFSDAYDLTLSTTAASTNADAVAAQAAADLATAQANGAPPATIAQLQAALTAANNAAAAAQQAEEDAADAFLAVQADLGVVVDNNTVVIPNVAADEGLSAPFNSWMTLFGQFFDHGLDLVAKGGAGTVYMPLKPDDPLYVEGSHTNFMVLTRATIDANGEATNLTTSWVDQNQTYTSHSSHQVFLREYVLDASGKPVTTGRLLNGADGGLPTWADVKAQARNLLGIQLDDSDVHNVPLLATDQYGKFIPHPVTGFAQIVVAAGPPPVLASGTPAAPVDATGALKTGHAFLDDIAHNAAPSTNNTLPADGDTLVGNPVPINPLNGQKLAYDNELLDAHYITGDGRGNENIGLTAVHHVFHSEHNRMVAQIKEVVLATNDPTFIAEWLVPGADQSNGIQDLEWNGERLFQAARIPTEMQYQHLVFEEFARTVQPLVDVFNDYDAAIDPSILAEFAHTVYRFGHSMLTETVDRYDPNFNVVGDADPNAPGDQQIGLIAAFLNPLEFAASGGNSEEAAGAIARGMTRQRGNEIDEFVTEALRNNLVGLPLDLAAINIARGRETGVPTLNQARRQFYEGSGDSQVKPYTSWADFALYLKNEFSIINFIAAYGTHSAITGEVTTEGKRAAAMAIVFGTTQTLSDGREIDAPADSLDFLRSTGDWASGPDGVTITGMDAVDFWIGGLAEKKMIFGGFLGSTFNFVFENQMEALQNGDRFYYLSRLANTNLTAQLENNKFAEIIARNTDASHLPGNVFTKPDYFLEVDQTKQFNEGLGSADPTGGGILNPLVIRGPGFVHYTGAEHVVLGGTEGNDTITGGLGDDTIWGDGGDDRLEGGEGVDFIFGGDGDDIITDLFLDDEIRSGAGNDVVNSGPGLDLIITDTGSDYVFLGEDLKEVLAGQGNDFVKGGEDQDFIIGGEGDDWLEGGGANNFLGGDNADLIQGLPIKIGVLGLHKGNDVLVSSGGNEDFDAEGGDDIMVAGLGTDRFFGQQGFDWATHMNDPYGVEADMEIRLFSPPPLPGSPGSILDRYDTVEGLAGSAFADILRGDNRADVTGEVEGGLGNDPLENTFLEHELVNISLIDGLQEFLGAGVTLFTGGNIIFGGDGSDIMEGRGGNDLIDGDRWLNVRISVRENVDGTGAEIMSFDRMTDELNNMMLNRQLNPGQLKIVREVLIANGVNDVDTALFSDVRANYIIEGENGVVVGADVDGDGFITVTHNIAGVIGADGIDRIKNVERLAFADVTLNIGPSTNDLPVGQAAILGIVREDEVLSISLAGVSDPDNVSSGGAIAGVFGVFWQVEEEPGTGIFSDIRRELADELVPVTGDTFIPGDQEVGLRLRARVIYQDEEGVLETVFSNITGPVININDAPVGTVNVSDTTPTEGQTIVASNSLSDQDSFGVSPGLLPVTYQWQQSVTGTGGWTNIAGATVASFTPGPAHVGRFLRVVATYVDGQGTTEVVPSAPTAIVGDLIIGTGTGATHTGTAGADFIDALGGSDTLNGGLGDDTLIGGAGNDQLNGGGGADSMNGGLGNDTFFVDDAGDVVAEAAGEGTDTVNTSLLSYTLGDNVERLVFTGTGPFNGVGNALNNVITTGTGNDTLVGGGGNDTLVGGAGNDTYVISSLVATITETTTGGTDTVLASGASYTLDTNVENLTFVGTGAFAGTGNGSANVIIGGAEADTLSGANGNDTLVGGAGADTIGGGAGNDRITGGVGDDELNGGAGADTFVFTPGFGNDRIISFGATPGASQDLIDVSGIAGLTADDIGTRIIISDEGPDVLITFTDTGDTILLVGIANPSTITSTDFIFGGP